MRQRIKKQSNLFLFGVLVIVLTFLIIDTIALPVLARPYACGTRACICFCVDRVGNCYCDVVKNVSCHCYCDNGDDDSCST